MSFDWLESDAQKNAAKIVRTVAELFGVRAIKTKNGFTKCYPFWPKRTVEGHSGWMISGPFKSGCVSTDVLFNTLHAEDGDFKSVAQGYCVSENAVRLAVEFEEAIISKGGWCAVLKMAGIKYRRSTHKPPSLTQPGPSRAGGSGSDSDRPLKPQDPSPKEVKE